MLALLGHVLCAEPAPDWIGSRASPHGFRCPGVQQAKKKEAAHGGMREPQSGRPATEQGRRAM